MVVAEVTGRADVGSEGFELRRDIESLLADVVGADYGSGASVEASQGGVQPRSLLVDDEEVFGHGGAIVGLLGGSSLDARFGASEGCGKSRRGEEGGEQDGETHLSDFF